MSPAKKTHISTYLPRLGLSSLILCLVSGLILAFYYRPIGNVFQNVEEITTLVLYGYGFGDEHINRVIKDMLTIPSSHLVIISYSDEGDRIKRFYEEAKRPAQISLMIGEHFGDLKTIVDGYLPKPAIDRATFRMVELLKSRGLIADE